MSQRSSFFALQGGLDQITQALVMPPGRAIACLNFESRDEGYARIDGYERFDGRPSPTAAGASAAEGAEAAAIAAARVLIAKPPGSGPVRGVWRFNGKTYAWRDNADATAGQMFVSSASGWMAVSATPAFPPGGRYDFVTHNFYGGTGTRAVYGVNGVGKAFTFNAAGTVTYIATGAEPEYPSRIAEFKEHLILGYPGGSLQGSQPGEPLAYSGTLGAFEIAIGDEIVDFSSTVDSLAIMAANSIHMLVGNDASDFVKKIVTDEAGAKPWTTQRVGTAMYLDNGGFRSVSNTQAYGDFALGTMTPQIKPTLKAKRLATIAPVGSTRVRGKSHYRIFFQDGSGLSIYMGRKYPEVMVFEMPFVVSCICSQEDADGRERVFAGATNGYVYELDVGTSFDGAAMPSFIMLAFNSIGSPRQLKRWHKVIAEMVAAPGTQINVAAEFDYAGAEQPAMLQQSFLVAGGGALYDTANWNEFFWDSAIVGSAEAYIEGQGKNMALIVSTVSTTAPGYILQGVSYDYSLRGQLR